MLRMHAFPAEAPDEVAAARIACGRALERWVTLGLGHEVDAAGARLFDPAEVTCFMKWCDAAGQDSFWRDHWVPTGRAFVEAMAAAGGGFSVSFRRRFDLTRFEGGAPLRLRAPLPLAGAYHSPLTIKVVVDPAPGVLIVEAPGRLEARLVTPTARDFTLGADISFTAPDASSPPLAGPLAPAEAAIYLRPVEDLIRVTPRIRDQARRLAGSAGPRDAVLAFWDHLMARVAIGQIRYDALDRERAVEQALDGEWSDCQVAAACLISLCRAHGLPARLIGGHLLYHLAPTKHYWAEVWLDGEGWRPFDLASWDLAQGGGDPGWSRRFAGQLEPRMVTECFPRLFVGPMSLRFPPAWQMLHSPLDPGAETLFVDVVDGSLIYRDELRVARLV